MKKLIVNTRDARKIRDAVGDITLYRVLKKPERGPLSEKSREAFPVGAKFWVAEPLVRISSRGESRDHFAADSTPKEWKRYTIPSAGSNTYKGQSRYVLEVVEVKEDDRPQYGKWFFTEVIFKKVRK